MLRRDRTIQTRLTLPVVTNERPSAWRWWLSFLSGAALLLLILYLGVRSLLPAQAGPVHLIVYAYSTQEEVLAHSILPAFEEAWEAETGRDLTIDSVLGPSATLAGQINLGAPADVAIFSNVHHVTYLRIGKLVEEDTEPAVIGHTPMVIVVRPENPLDLYDFRDLSRDGVRLLHASPRSSGGGEWAVLAEYGSVQLASGDEALSPDEVAAAQLRAIWRNVCLLAPSARAAMTLFELGAGDALVTYEQDALLAQSRGVPLDIVIPSNTIIAEPAAVIVDRNVTQTERPVAEAFVRFLLSAEGQDRLARYYQRPASGEDTQFPPLRNTFTVADLGGWSSAYQQVVETVWQNDIEPRLNLEVAPQLLTPDSSLENDGCSP